MGEIAISWWPELQALVPPMRGEGEPVPPAKLEIEDIFEGVLPAEQVTRLLADASPAALARAIGQLWDHVIKHPAKTNPRRVNALFDRWFLAWGSARGVELTSVLPTAGGSFENGLAIFDLSGTVATWEWLGRARRLLAHATDYDAALAWAERSLASWSHAAIARHEIAAAYSFLFPDHRPFFEAALTGPDTEAVPTYLFGSVTREEDLPAIMNGKRVRMFWSGECGLHLATQFGPRGYALMRDHVWDNAGTPYAEALGPYAGEEPATDILRFLDEAETRPYVQAYFAHHVALRPILEKATTTGRKPAQKAAAKILEKLAAPPKAKKKP